jgi:hypothetical protein
MRILAAFMQEHRLYAHTIANVIQQLRPHVEISVVEPGALETELTRLEPHLVISDRPKNAVDPGGRSAWLEIPTEPTRSAKLYLNRVYWEEANPGKAELLWAVDETESFLRARGDLESC